MSFAITHQNKVDKAGDVKTSTPTKHTSYPAGHHNIKNLDKNSADSIFHLQRAIDNQAVQRLIHSTNAKGFDFAKIGIQPKLKVSQPDDAYEQEADRVAEEVMRTSVINPFTSTVPNNDELIGRKCAACEIEEEEEKMEISRKPSATSDVEESDQVTNVINNVRSSSGSSLDSSTKKFMESRFVYDFSKVKIHTDETAARSSDDISALAYTVGNDIVFGRKQYQPNTAHGRRLLAHELTHVIQQTAADRANLDHNNDKHDLSPLADYPGIRHDLADAPQRIGLQRKLTNTSVPILKKVDEESFAKLGGKIEEVGDTTGGGFGEGTAESNEFLLWNYNVGRAEPRAEHVEYLNKKVLASERWPSILERDAGLKIAIVGGASSTGGAAITTPLSGARAKGDQGFLGVRRHRF